MSEREDLLNNLKIDRSKNPIEDESSSRKLIILGLAVFIVGVFSWIFLSEDELKEVTTFTVKSLQMSDSSATSILDASGYVVARRRATVSSKMTGKVIWKIVVPIHRVIHTKSAHAFSRPLQKFQLLSPFKLVIDLRQAFSPIGEKAFCVLQTFDIGFVYPLIPGFIKVIKLAQFESNDLW